MAGAFGLVAAWLALSGGSRSEAPKAAAKFSAADIPTATLGLSARVEIEVATALAVSWKPLVKSNASAATTTMISSNSEPTAVAFPIEGPPGEKTENDLWSP